MQEKYSPVITQSRFENICSSHIYFFLTQKFFLTLLPSVSAEET